MLEPIHFLPTLATLSSLIILITLIVIKVPLLQIFLIYFLPLSLVSLIGCLTKKDIRIFPFLLMVIPIQVIGYGLGFFKAFLLRVLLKKTEYTGFTKNYYK